jgi:hypothetical protein
MLSLHSALGYRTPVEARADMEGKRHARSRLTF